MKMQFTRSDLSDRVVSVSISSAAWHDFAKGASGISIASSGRIQCQKYLASQFEYSFGSDACAILKETLKDRTCGIAHFNLTENTNNIPMWSLFLVALGKYLGTISIKPHRREGFEAGLITDPSNSVGPSHLPSPYNEDLLHNDGNKLNQEFDDYVAILISTKENCIGGQSKLLHLDDWSELSEFVKSPYAELPFNYIMRRNEIGSLSRTEALNPASKEMISIMERSLFYKSANGFCSRISPGYMHPADPSMWEYIQKVQTALAETHNCIDISLEVGQFWIVNNNFVLHGRRKILPNKDLYRVVHRVKGFFK